MSATPSNWELLKACKPVLSPNVEYEARLIRDTQWMVIRNTVKGDNIRLNASAAELLSRIDGDTTLEALCNEGATNSVTPDQLCAWLAPLSYSGLVSLGANSEDERLLEQSQAQSVAARKGRMGNPLAIKFPLHNPDRWLGYVVNKLPWMFSRWFLVAVLSVMTTALLAAIFNASAIMQALSRVAASPTHWWLYGLLYPALKAIHEIGHALIIKHWGGSVHETGITLLVLMPVPYVDASDAWMFPKKYQRVLVGAAGMVAECLLASIGLFIFLLVQPGLLREFGFAVFVMGSLSTLLFNANPLLKFDGYYILQDWLDIPNLSTRSMRYCRYLVRKYVFRVESAVSPASAIGERRWLLSYGILSVLYRCFITVVIALFLASQYLILGVALALFALFQLLIKPLVKLVHYLRHSTELSSVRSQSMAKSAGFVFVLSALIAFMPMPSSSRTEGVVWVPQQAQVFANQAGVIEEVLVNPGAPVKRGQLLLRLSAPALLTKQQVVDAKLATAQIEYRALQQSNTNEAQLLAADIQTQRSELKDLNRRIAKLDIVASNDGTFVLEKNALLIGRYVRQGELLAYVVDKKNLMVKAVLEQQRIERVQAGVKQVSVRLADRFDETLEATLTRQTPAALNSLPSPALAYDGKSGIAVASHTDETLKTIERVFHIELALPSQPANPGIGGRAYVTLHHQPESLGKRWWRSARQLLLKQLTV